MKTSLEHIVMDAYKDKAAAFFEKLKAMNLTDEELNAIPSLFLPGWGENYESSFFKVAIVGKETMYWSNEHGDSLKCDIVAHEKGQYDVLASCRRFREQGPAEWRNQFWQYPAMALAKLFDCTRDDILQKDNPILRSIAWFNGHAVETYNSQGVEKTNLSEEKMAAIQNIADECGLSDFETFAKVFRPHVIIYFYRNQSGIPTRCFPPDIERVQEWGQNNLATEWRIDGRTLLLQFPHTRYLAQKYIPQENVADIVSDVLEARNVKTALCDKDAAIDFYRMSAVEWVSWVEFAREEARKQPSVNNMELSRHLIAVVAHELAKRQARMNAQTLVLILNEVDKFRQDGWQYSPERRGPCSSVRGAYRTYLNDGKTVEANYIERAFTKLDGSYAYE